MINMINTCLFVVQLSQWVEIKEKDLNLVNSTTRTP